MRKEYTVELLSTAEEEMAEAFEWYEEQQVGLSAKLLEEITHYLDLISSKPLHFPVRFNNNHVAVLKKFPYLIVYKIDELSQTIFVNAFFHSSRNPRKLNR